MPRPAKKPCVTLGPITLRALSGEPGAWRWRAEWYPPGQEGRMATRTLSRRRGERFDEDEAVTRAAELLAEGVHLGVDAKQSADTAQHRRVETVLDLMEAWLGAQRDRIGAGIRQSTFRGYRAQVLVLRSEPIADVRLSEVTTTHLVRLLGNLRARYGDQTVAKTMTTTKTAFHWGAKAGAIAKVPPWPLWRPDRPEQRMPSVQDVMATVEALVAMGPDQTPRGKRTQTLLAIRLMFETGARPGECVAAHRCDFDDHQGTWRIRSGEGSKTGTRMVPIQPQLMAKIRALGEGPVFPPLRTADSAAATWNRWITRGASQAGVRRWTCKGLRHLAVTRMLTAGVDVKTAASITGHSAVVLLRTYAHVLDASRRRAAEVLATVPRGAVVPFPAPKTHQTQGNQ